MLAWVIRVLFIPGGVILSTMFGGGYASGQEIATFVSTSGPWGGLLAVVTLGLVFGLTLAVAFELSRLFRKYEYAGFMRLLLGRGAVIYEVTLVVGLFLVLAVAATAGGTIVEEHFGFPQLLATAILMGAAIALTYLGRRVVEWSMTLAAGLLIALLAGLLVVVLGADGSAVVRTFEAEPFDPGFWEGGGRYGVLAAAFVPLVLFAARHIRTRRESLAAGLFAGAVVALPALVFHVTFMADYPAIFDEEVPSYAMATMYGGPLFVDVFVLVIFVLIAQTAIGGVQGLNERIDTWADQQLGRNLRPVERAGIAAAALIGTVVLSTFGLATLVASGYGLLSLIFIVTFTIPLFTVGLWRIWQMNRVDQEATDRSSPIEGEPA